MQDLLPQLLVGGRDFCMWVYCFSLSPNWCEYAVNLPRFETVFERHPYVCIQVWADGSESLMAQAETNVMYERQQMAWVIISQEFVPLQSRDSID